MLISSSGNRFVVQIKESRKKIYSNEKAIAHQLPSTKARDINVPIIISQDILSAIPDHLYYQSV